MAMQAIEVTITGVSPLLSNNPQTVDRFNPFARKMAAINAKKTRRTDDDFRELRDLEMESKCYVDPELGLYVPTTWLTSAIAGKSFAVCKISKADARGAIFATEQRTPLQCKGRELVKTATDVAKNPQFRHLMLLPQNGKRLAKAIPIFHDWSFSTVLEFDDKIMDPGDLERVIQHAAKYGGFGDFRPTFGRAFAEIDHA